jgi:hypothetical protein
MDAYIERTKNVAQKLKKTYKSEHRKKQKIFYCKASRGRSCWGKLGQDDEKYESMIFMAL